MGRCTPATKFTIITSEFFVLYLTALLVSSISIKNVLFPSINLSLAPILVNIRSTTDILQKLAGT